MNNLVIGAGYLFDGFKLITRRGLRRFVIIPLLINVMLFVGMFFLLRHFVIQFDQWFAQLLPSWLQWLSSVLWLIFFLSFFIIILYTFFTLANIVSAPFNSFLAEQVELYLTGKVPEERGLADNLRDIPRIIARQLSIIGYYIPRALLILILFFIPVVQAAAAVVSFLFHAWLMTLTYMDYPTDNHRVSMPDVRAWLNVRRFSSLGFGVSVLVCSMIPVLNCFTIPAAVAGATKFWIEEGNENRQHSSR
ncbi:Sulfate transporter CysZ [Aquicella siphonis]|uniref:Sulfate transporter CysZ n=1 Tax=Aquicella siphonis TaxID=254247 RepID=A0A5E4PH71_9COXI|nr:sulfate transporter CysZ [Aquicella siphonis]VVC75671.1 Sulfate transporter CysZ [Aquicella siphonis]